MAVSSNRFGIISSGNGLALNSSQAYATAANLLRGPDNADKRALISAIDVAWNEHITAGGATQINMRNKYANATSQMRNVIQANSDPNREIFLTQALQTLERGNLRTLGASAPAAQQPAQQPTPQSTPQPPRTGAQQERPAPAQQPTPQPQRTGPITVRRELFVNANGSLTNKGELVADMQRFMIFAKDGGFAGMADVELSTSRSADGVDGIPGRRSAAGLSNILGVSVAELNRNWTREEAVQGFNDRMENRMNTPAFRDSVIKGLEQAIARGGERDTQHVSAFLRARGVEVGTDLTAALNSYKTRLGLEVAQPQPEPEPDPTPAPLPNANRDRLVDGRALDQAAAARNRWLRTQSPAATNLPEQGIVSIFEENGNGGNKTPMLIREGANGQLIVQQISRENASTLLREGAKFDPEVLQDAERSLQRRMDEGGPAPRSFEVGGIHFRVDSEGRQARISTNPLQANYDRLEREFMSSNVVNEGGETVGHVETRALRDLLDKVDSSGGLRRHFGDAAIGGDARGVARSLDRIKDELDHWHDRRNGEAPLSVRFDQAAGTATLQANGVSAQIPRALYDQIMARAGANMVEAPAAARPESPHSPSGEQTLRDFSSAASGQTPGSPASADPQAGAQAEAVTPENAGNRRQQLMTETAQNVGYVPSGGAPGANA